MSSAYTRAGGYARDEPRIGDWLNSNQTTIPSSLTSLEYPLRLIASSRVVPVFSSEGFRFAIAAEESYDLANKKWSIPTDRSGIGWKFVSLYYSSFYSAHAILRFSGKSVSQIDSWRIIQRQFAAYGPIGATANNLRCGYHRVHVDKSFSEIQVDLAVTSSGKGSHEALWSAFKEHCDECYSNTKLNSSSHLKAFGEYTKHAQGSIHIDSRLNKWPWMNSGRNWVNYKLPDLFWGDNKRRINPTKNSDVSRMISDLSIDDVFQHGSSQDQVMQFTAGCLYPIIILRGLISQIRTETPKSIPASLK